MEIKREDIINRLNDRFINDDTVYAFWLEGADAIGTIDSYSDLDIWFDIKDDFEDLFIKQLKNALSNISSIDFFYEKGHLHPKIRQLFFHLEETSDFLIIDLCIQSHSRKIEFTIENKDEEVKVIFDKANVIKYRHLNMSAFKIKLSNRIEELSKTYKFFSIWVIKEIKRGNYLEAFNYYHTYILNPLVELCRIKNQPTKKDYRLKHIKRDLPIDLVEELENLYKISSLKEIEQKTKEAILFFKKIMEGFSK